MTFDFNCLADELHGLSQILCLRIILVLSFVCLSIKSFCMYFNIKLISVALFCYKAGLVLLKSLNNYFKRIFIQNSVSFCVTISVKIVLLANY